MNVGEAKSPQAQEAIRRWDELRELPGRAQWERDCEDIARLIRPQRGGFGSDTPANRTMQKPLSSEPILAQSSFAAGIYAGITNPASPWVGLETEDEDLNAWQPMAEWNDLATKRVLRSFSPSVSSFYPSTFQCYSDIAAFGNGAGYDEIDLQERRFIDVTVSLASVVVDIDAHGRICEAVYKFQLRPIAAMRQYGEAVPKKIKDFVEKGKNTEHTNFFMQVKRNETFEKGRLGVRGKRWIAVHACELEQTLVRVGGFEEMPFYYPRWDVDTGMTQGTGPGFIALASTRAHHLMDAATLRAAQNAADPATLAPDRDGWPLNGRLTPGQTIYGGLSPRGERMLRPYEVSGNIGLTMEEKNQKIEAIKDAFHYTIMSVVGRTGLTTEETQVIEEARLRNWAPNADRIMEEYAARKVERRFRMLWRAGQIPPPPKEAEGRGLRMRYQSAAAMAMRAREGLAITKFINDLAPLAALNEGFARRAADRLDPDATIEALHDASPALPARMLRSREAADEMAKARAQQEQGMQALAAAKEGAGALKDAAGAAAMMQGGA